MDAMDVKMLSASSVKMVQTVTEFWETAPRSRCFDRRAF